MKNAIITLCTPVEGPGEYITSIELRPVTYAEYCEKGSPFEVIPLDNGEEWVKVDRPKLLELAIALVVSPGGQRALREATDPRDFARIEEEMRNFFLPAKSSSVPTQTSPSAPEKPSTTLIG